MIVNQFNTHWSGGASIAARRLHEALPAVGVTSRFWFANLPTTVANRLDYGDWSSWEEPVGPWQKVSSAVWRKWRKREYWANMRTHLSGRSAELEMFSLPRPFDARFVAPLRREGDILHFHWIAGLLDAPSFFGAIPDDFPIVWTLHDMNPFTGGCHFSSGCSAFREGCGNCPQLCNSGPRDLSQRSFQVKQRAYRGKNLHVVTPSRWLTRAAEQSRIFQSAKSIETIPYGLDTDTFSPRDKAGARRTLGLDDEGIVIAFGADSIANRRKGFPELVAALTALRTTRPLVGLVFGGGQFELADSPLSRLHRLGFVEDPNRQAEIYSAADMVIVPSLEDNSPNVGLESLACGTPVIGFDVGGIPDYVRPGETGLLARPGDAADLARQIAWLAERPEERLQMARNAREVAVREYDQLVQAQQYKMLYERLLSELAKPIRRGLAA